MSQFQVTEVMPDELEIKLNKLSEEGFEVLHIVPFGMGQPIKLVVRKLPIYIRTPFFPDTVSFNGPVEHTRLDCVGVMDSKTGKMSFPMKGQDENQSIQSRTNRGDFVSKRGESEPSDSESD